MDYRNFGDCLVVRLDRGEEIVSSIEKICRKENITLGSIEGIGAADHAVIGLYDVGERFFHQKVLDEPLEITSVTGNISTKDGEIYLHIHISLADAEMKMTGGHLKECRISATAELFIRRLEGCVERKLDEAVTGLNLYEFQ